MPHLKLTKRVQGCLFIVISLFITTNLRAEPSTLSSRPPVSLTKAQFIMILKKNILVPALCQRVPTLLSRYFDNSVEACSQQLQPLSAACITDYQAKFPQYLAKADRVHWSSVIAACSLERYKLHVAKSNSVEKKHSHLTVQSADTFQANEKRMLSYIERNGTPLLCLASTRFLKHQFNNDSQFCSRELAQPLNICMHLYQSDLQAYLSVKNTKEWASVLTYCMLTQHQLSVAEKRTASSSSARYATKARESAANSLNHNSPDKVSLQNYVVSHANSPSKFVKNYIVQLKQKAVQGDTDAQILLGRVYIEQEHYHMAITVLKTAAPYSVEARAYLNVAHTYLRKKFLFIKQLAEKNNLHAQTLIGVAYLHGIGTKQDIQKGINWLTRAANSGYVDAQLGLAGFYDEGHFVERDYQKSLFWLTKAAEAGDAEAQYNLATAYLEGYHGILPKQPAKAIYWYEQAAKQNYADAFTNLGVMYNNGIGVKPDHVKALQLYKKAAELGDVTAMYNIAFHYERGKGVKQNYSAAAYWLKRSAAHHQRCAIHDLGRLYAKGAGVAQNPQMAMKYYRYAVLMLPDQANADVGDEGFLKYTPAQAANYARYMVSKSLGQPLNMSRSQRRTSKEIEKKFVEMCWQ